MKTSQLRGWCGLLLGLAVVTQLGCQNTETVEEKPAAKTPAPTGSIVYYPTGYRETSVLAVERVAPAEVTLGVPFEYKLLVTNLTKLSLGDVVISDVCAGHFKVDGSSPQAQALPDGVLRWNLGTFAPAETKTIIVRGSATSLDPVKNCVTASWDQRSCSTINVVQPALKLALTAPAEVIKCDPIPVQYVVTNSGTGVARNVVVSETLAQGLTSSSGASAVSVNVGDLGPGQSKTINETLKASATGKYTHNAVAAATGDLKANATAATAVKAPALTLTATDGGKLYVGRTQKIDFTVTNKGDGDARDTVLTYTAPAGVKVANTATGSSVVGTQYVWKLGTLKPGASSSGSVMIEPTAIGTYNSSVSASAYCADAKVATPVTLALGIPAVLLEVVDENDPIEVGGNEVYVITVTNQGSAVDQNIKITCTLEDTMQFVSATGATAGKADGKTVTFAALPSLAAKGVATWKVTVKALSAGDVRFSTKMTTDNLSRPVEETEATNFYK
ncbi:MAG: DUF11 domain-containing protein [Planctomycetes bacterium]|nr:DUF11 domain-containing protein [Planctomycetota bacterium]